MQQGLDFPGVPGAEPAKQGGVPGFGSGGAVQQQTGAKSGSQNDNGGDDGGSAFASSGLRFLSSALHAFTRENGMVMHTPPGAPFLRVPAVFDSELPSPAALLVRALRLACALRGEAPYADAIHAIYTAAAPAMRAEPLACASLIDAVNP